MIDFISPFFHPLSLSPVAVLLKDDYFVRGAGLPGRFKAEKMEFHWGQNNASPGSEHSINGRRFPAEVKHPVTTIHSDKCATRGPRGSMLSVVSLPSYCIYIYEVFIETKNPLPKLFVNATDWEVKDREQISACRAA